MILPTNYFQMILLCGYPPTPPPPPPPPPKKKMIDRFKKKMGFSLSCYAIIVKEM